MPARPTAYASVRTGTGLHTHACTPAPAGLHACVYTPAQLHTHAGKPVQARPLAFTPARP
eukprot:3398686-Pleurochrysis_carterae.AAC.2